ncbi:nitroreductase family protein [Bacillus chungangensis]|uniref:NAD(P)H nitroreductase n=1 Tax=Bacillus chungangensis TaxID=587633 RepID=A0ABT9WQM2_9BACI|nr:nitroreductase family protein [Bacillus chungangensis]MDQ0175584.1 putative NAD(P)H nitroreductase [Bacillus chungangensis]
MENFEQLVMNRRSANNFLEGNPITQKQLDEIFELVKLGPSAFNLQHTRYIAVLNQELKEKVKKAANGQYKVGTASAVVIVLGDTLAYQDAGEIYEGLQSLGILNKQEYDAMVEDTTSFYQKRGESFQHDEAIRNASLSAMLFMLAAKAKGWDTCPMIGFDPEQIKDVFQISDRFEPVMLITIGKEKTASRQPRGYRRPMSEFVHYHL